MVDITFDLETTALVPTAAIMSIGAVAWKRNGISSPFYEKGDGVLNCPEFSEHVDLRDMFIAGFTFDQDTAEWWSRQSIIAQEAVLADDNTDSPCSHIDVVIKDFFDYIEHVKTVLGDDDVNLWCQGTDFDIAILRNICYKIHLPFEKHIKHSRFRDHRTFFFEGARLWLESAGKPFSEEEAFGLVKDYDQLNPYGAVHDPIYDCKRSIYNTWQMMNLVKSLNTVREEG